VVPSLYWPGVMQAGCSQLRVQGRAFWTAGLGSRVAVAPMSRARARGLSISLRQKQRRCSAGSSSGDSMVLTESGSAEWGISDWMGNSQAPEQAPCSHSIGLGAEQAILAACSGANRTAGCDEVATQVARRHRQYDGWR